MQIYTMNLDIDYSICLKWSDIYEKDNGCEGMNVSEVKGRGRQMGIRESYRGSSYCIDLIPKTRLELVVNDEDLERILDVIVESAHTGEVGDGKIFVSDVAEVIRIRTGERGSDAV